METIGKIFVFAAPLFILSAIKDTPFIKGIIGESRVNYLLIKYLDKNKYHLIKDIILKIGDDSTQIDHIIVSIYGIFVIETKNMSGWIFGKEKDKNWTQKKFYKKIQFQNPLHQNYKHIKYIENLTGISENKIYSIITFTGSCDFKTETPVNVLKIKNLIEYIKYKDSIFLTENEVDNVVEKLKIYKKENSIKTKIKHIYNIKNKNTISNIKKEVSYLNMIYEVVIKSIILKNIIKSSLIIGILFILLSSINYLPKNHFILKCFPQINDNKITIEKRDNKNNTNADGTKSEIKIVEPEKYKGAIYSWTNKEGKKVFSNVGFPKDEAYTDGKIELH